MMHGGMAWMMAAMWLFFVLLFILAILGVVLGLRALWQTSGPGGAGPVGDPRPRAGPAALDEEKLDRLDPAEHRLVEILREREGEAPQGDLVGLTGFSKAKVSRTLDRLDQKRLVIRLRRGMGNRVLLTPMDR